MKLLSRSGLMATVTAAGLLVAMAHPASACLGSKLNGVDTPTTLDGPSSLGSQTPDGRAMGIALGSFGAIASLLAGGFILYRKQKLAEASEAAGVAILEETALPENPLESAVSTDAAAEKELVLTR